MYISPNTNTIATDHHLNSQRVFFKITFETTTQPVQYALIVTRQFVFFSLYDFSTLTAMADLPSRALIDIATVTAMTHLLARALIDIDLQSKVARIFVVLIQMLSFIAFIHFSEMNLHHATIFHEEF